MTIDLQMLLQSLFGILAAAFAYFIKSTMERVEKSIEDLRNQQMTIQIMDGSIKSLVENLKKIESDVKDASKIAMELNTLQGRLAIFERNEQAIWKRIDELKSWQTETHSIQDKEFDLIRKRTHHFNNRLMVIKGSLEKLQGTCFVDNWNMP